jgi:hypothetical protein
MPRENYKHSEETKRKIGMAIKGRKLSEEHKKKISIARMGNIGYWVGKKLSIETKIKMSISHKGKKLSEEHKRKIGEKRKGHLVSIETRQKIRKGLKGYKHTDEFKEKCRKNSIGKKFSKETREKLSIISKASGCIENTRKYHFPTGTKWKMSEEAIKNITTFRTRGKDHWNWKGGATPKNIMIRMSTANKNWRKAVFSRDNYTCQECGKRGVKINAHHIKPFAVYPELRFLVENGITLCKKCHIELHKKH